jgi:hydrogenase nickel incorporation protein HypA/HybF
MSRTTEPYVPPPWGEVENRDELSRYLVTTAAPFLQYTVGPKVTRAMHELPVTESILKIVLRHAPAEGVKRIVRIFLEIGELSDLEDEWIQHYFDYLSKGTVAENAQLVIQRTPIMFQCDACAHVFEIKREALQDLQCPECGNTGCTLVSGKGYYIKNMEVI